MIIYYTQNPDKSIDYISSAKIAGQRGYTNSADIDLETQIKVVDGKSYFIADAPEPTPPSPAELRAQFDAAVTAHLEAFATSQYSAAEQPFDSMDRARLASLTTDYKQWGDIANSVYDATWKAAETLMPQVIDGTLSIDDALAQLPVLSWDSADEAETEGTNASAEAEASASADDINTDITSEETADAPAA